MKGKSNSLRPLKKLELTGVKMFGGILRSEDLCKADAVILGEAVTMEYILDLLLHNEVISL